MHTHLVKLKINFTHWSSLGSVALIKRIHQISTSVPHHFNLRERPIESKKICTKKEKIYILLCLFTLWFCVFCFFFFLASKRQERTKTILIFLFVSLLYFVLSSSAPQLLQSICSRTLS